MSHRSMGASGFEEKRREIPAKHLLEPLLVVGDVEYSKVDLFYEVELPLFRRRCRHVDGRYGEVKEGKEVMREAVVRRRASYPYLPGLDQVED